MNPRNLAQAILLAALALPAPAGTPDDARPTGTDRPPTSGPRIHLLVAGKGGLKNPPEMQQRAIDAVRMVSEGARTFRPSVTIETLAEQVMTVPEFRSGGKREKCNGRIFRQRLKRLAETTSPEDTVIIYTHTHGRKAGFEDSQPLGGLVVDLPVIHPEHRGTLLWNDYADVLLGIPAKNVVVLTMSCFSGGFVDYLNSPAVSTRWSGRREKEGRSFLVITSQNSRLQSPPIVKDGTLVNPFTHAVARALAGEADGFTLQNGRPAGHGKKDGRLSFGELTDFILHVTGHTVSESPRRRNIAKPQFTGSFERGDILIPAADRPPEAPDQGRGNGA